MELYTGVPALLGRDRSWGGCNSAAVQRNNGGQLRVCTKGWLGILRRVLIGGRG
jgi:hypothetical protein